MRLSPNDAVVVRGGAFWGGFLLFLLLEYFGTVYFIGADIGGVVLFECILVFAAQFEHSSVKVPEWFERTYWLFFVPPSMHRIHHSVVIRERNTNYGTIFSVWDRIFGSLLRDVEQETIVIGLGPYRSPDKLKIGNLLVMPFTRPVR